MKHLFRVLLSLSVTAVIIGSCKKKGVESAPVVSTTAVSGITANSAQTGGDITGTGGSSITLSGICYALHNNPSLTDSLVPNGASGAGPFSSSLQNLNANTAYYVRAFATNGTGTGYGAVNSFTTSPGLATIITTPVSNNQALSANSGWTLVNSGGSAITAIGICWSTSPNPTITSSSTTDSTSATSATDTLRNLSLTTYYVRAYATNSAGTAYGSQITFTVATTSTVADIDGNSYGTVTIGTQTWTTSNLRVIHYQNGDLIDNAFTDPLYDWYNGTTGGGYVFANADTTTKAAYGLLYSNFATTDPRNIAPAGWHVATDQDWDTLEVIEGLPAADTGVLVIGVYGTIGPALQVGGSSGLNLQLAGEFYAPTATIYYFGTRGYYWTSTPATPVLAWDREVYGTSSPNYPGVNRNYSGSQAFAVRCVKNK